MLRAIHQNNNIETNLIRYSLRNLLWVFQKWFRRSYFLVLYCFVSSALYFRVVCAYTSPKITYFTLRLYTPLLTGEIPSDRTSNTSWWYCDLRNHIITTSNNCVSYYIIIDRRGGAAVCIYCYAYTFTITLERDENTCENRHRQRSFIVTVLLLLLLSLELLWRAAVGYCIRIYTY